MKAGRSTVRVFVVFVSKLMKENRIVIKEKLPRFDSERGQWTVPCWKLACRRKTAQLITTDNCSQVITSVPVPWEAIREDCSETQFRKGSLCSLDVLMKLVKVN